MEGVGNFSPRHASHRTHGRGRSKLHLILRATAPVGGVDGVLSKLPLVFGAGGASHRRPRAAWGCYLAGGGWRLRGVEVEDEPQALDFVSNGCKID